VHAVWSPVRDYIGTRVIGVLSCFARAGVAGRRFVDEGGNPSRFQRYYARVGVGLRLLGGAWSLSPIRQTRIGGTSSRPRHV
jgi:hypothetical protein